MGIAVRHYDNGVAKIRDSVDLRAALCPGVSSSKRYVLRHCPVEIHGKADSNPSLAVNKDYWYCFGCGNSGDVFSWIMRVGGVTFPDAVDIARRGVIPQGRVEINGHSRSTVKKPTWASDFKREWYSLDVQNRTGWIISLSNGMDKRERGYFTDSRRISSKVVSDAMLGYHPCGAYTIPVWDRRGVLAGVKLRRDDNKCKEPPKYDSVDLPLIYHERGIARSIQRKRPLVLTEGELDALVVLSIPNGGFEAVTFTYGAESVARWWRTLQERMEKPTDFWGVNRLLVAFDGDEAGRNAELAALGIFTGFVPIVRSVHFPDGAKDVTDFVVANGFDPLSNLLKGISGVGGFKRVWTVR